MQALTTPCKVDSTIPVDQKGYPRKYHKSAAGVAYYHEHRWQLAQKLGRDMRPGEETRHRCRTRACIAWDHLEPGTAKDNNADRRRDGTIPCGIHHPRAKLTPDKIAAARERLAIRHPAIRRMSRGQVARLCGVSLHALNDALAGRTWAESEAA
jgi:hypothetical protein